MTERLPKWEALDLIPNEAVPEDINDTRPIQYGMPRWRDLFNVRQLYGHVISVEIFRELLTEAELDAELSDVKRAAFGYLALCLDKLRDYNSRMTRWHVPRQVMVNTFDRHDFSFKWSYAEMPPLIVGFGYDWAIEQTARCVGELIEMARPDIDVKKVRLNGGSGDLLGHNRYMPPPITVTARSADDLDYLDDHSIDVVIIDPPYGANVWYAELSDFFYVWLKRTAGHVYPYLFTRPLTDRDSEAVASPARFRNERGRDDLAIQDYRERMAAIFAECRRILKPDGIMTLMFTHKATGAWDALTTGLMEAGFAVNASWPINTEAEGSLHIKDKASASSTVFLVCHPRQERAADADDVYWEDLEPRVRQAVRRRIGEFLKRAFERVSISTFRHSARRWRSSRDTGRSGAAGHVCGRSPGDGRRAFSRTSSTLTQRRPRMRSSRPARGQGLAAQTTGGQRQPPSPPRSADRVVRARLGRLRGAGGAL